MQERRPSKPKCDADHVHRRAVEMIPDLRWTRAIDALLQQRLDVALGAKQVGGARAQHDADTCWIRRLRHDSGIVERFRGGVHREVIAA